MDISKFQTVTAFASRWSDPIAERYDLLAFAPEKTCVGPSRAFTNVPLGIPDHVSDEDAADVIDRVVSDIRTVTPSEVDHDGLRILRVQAASREVGGRPGLVARLDIQRR